MKQKTVFGTGIFPVIVFLVFLVTAPSVSFGLNADGLVFGPVTLTRDEGEPFIQVVEFEVGDTEGNFFLLVDSSSQELADHPEIVVSSAQVSFNGNDILDPSDFWKKESRKEIPLDISDLNRLEVELRGKPGSVLQLRVVKRVDCSDTGCAPYSVVPVVEALNAQTVSIGPEGGEINVSANDGTRHTLTFPEGALGIPVDITLTPVARVEGLPLLGGLASAVQFEPRGLVLAKPAQLRIDFTDTLPPGQWHAFGWGGESDEFYLDPARVGESHVEMTIAHFSGAGVAAGTVKDATALDVTGGSLLDFTVRTLIAQGDIALQAACNYGSCTTQEELEAYFDAYFLMLKDIFEQYAKDVDTLVTLSDRDSLRWAVAMREVTAFQAILAEWFLCDSPESSENECNSLHASLEEKALNWNKALIKSVVKVFEKLGEPVCDDPVIKKLVKELEALDLGAQVSKQVGVSGLGEVQSKYGCRLVLTVDNFPAEITEDEEAPPVEFTVSARYRPTGEPIDKLIVSIRSSSATDSCAVLDGDAGGDYFTGPDGLIHVALTARNCFGRPASVVIRGDEGHYPSENPEESMIWAQKILQLEAAVVKVDDGPRILPQEVVLDLGESIQLVAEVPGVEDPVVEWSAEGGEITSDGLYTAGYVPGEYTVTLKVELDGHIVTTYRKLVIDGTAIRVSPESVIADPGEKIQFSAFVQGPEDTSVSWDATGGDVTDGGLFTAPDAGGEYLVTATSNADTGALAVAKVTVSVQEEVDLEGWYVGQILEDWDYGEDHGGGFYLEGSVYHWSELDDDGNLQEFLQLFRFNRVGTFNATIDGSSFSGFSTNDSSSCLVNGIPSCPVHGNITVTDTEIVIRATAVYSLKCECYTVFEVRRTR